MAFTLSSQQILAQQRAAPRASRRASALRVSAQAGKSGEAVGEIYIGKGKTVKDDPKKYPDRVRARPRRVLSVERRGERCMLFPRQLRQLAAGSALLTAPSCGSFDILGAGIIGDADRCSERPLLLTLLFCNRSPESRRTASASAAGPAAKCS